jgi:hypothetical protein
MYTLSPYFPPYFLAFLSPYFRVYLLLTAYTSGAPTRITVTSPLHTLRCKMTPQEIGDKGELKVTELCQDAKLSVSQLLPDRTGKDRVIEWPLPPLTGAMSLDTRPSPLTCVLQIKSILEKKKSIRIKLSAAELLARDLRPAFIAVPRIRRDSSVKDLHLIHLRGDNLSRILKRLREATKSGTRNTSSIFLEIPLSAGKALTFNPTDFRNTLEEAIGPSIASYSLQKQTELNNLGFDHKNRIKIRVNFGNMNPEKIIQGLLGLTDLPAVKIEISELRYGIELEGTSLAPDVPKSITGAISITPRESPAKVTAINNAGKKFILNGHMIAANLPNVVPDVGVTIFRSDLIEIKFGPNRGLELMPNKTSQAWSLSIWEKNYRFLKMANDEMAYFFATREPDNWSTKRQRLVRQKKYTKHITKVLTRIDLIKDLIKFTSCAEPVVSYLEFMNLDERTIRLAHSVATKERNVEFSFTQEKGIVPAFDAGAAILFNVIKLGSVKIAVACRCSFNSIDRKSIISWRSDPLKLLDTMLLDDDEKSYEKFKSKIKNISAIEQAIDIDEAFKDEALIAA